MDKKSIIDTINMLFDNLYYNCILINNSNEKLIINNFNLRSKLNNYFKEIISGSLDDSLVYIKFIDKFGNYLNFKVSDYLFADITLSKTLDNK